MGFKVWMGSGVAILTIISTKKKSRNLLKYHGNIFSFFYGTEKGWVRRGEKGENFPVELFVRISIPFPWMG